MKILFIDSWNNVGDFFRFHRSKVKNLDNFGLYKNDSFFNKLFRYMGLHIYKPFLFFSYGNWKKNIKNYDMFIIESRKTFEYLINYINKKCPEKRIVVWYWNEVTSRELDPNYIRKKYHCETWTFDLNDAKRYNMNFNDTYYFDDIDLKSSEYVKNDLFYVGIDREGRIELLEEIKNKLQSIKKSYSFFLTVSPIKPAQKNYNYSDKMLYDEVVENIKHTRAILDLTKQTQYGLTLRPMEAIFFKKKLITNNENIVKYDFYNPKNILIYNNNTTCEEIREFLESEYEPIKTSIIEFYKFENWLKRIVEFKGAKK